MKALLVNGSPHKSGCTHTALQLVGDGLREAGVGTDEFWIGAKPIAGCIGCYKCAVHGNTPDEVMRDEEGVQVMQVLGRNMAWLLEAIEAGRAAGVEEPVQPEHRVGTNFIR